MLFQTLILYLLKVLLVEFMLFYMHIHSIIIYCCYYLPMQRKSKCIFSVAERSNDWLNFEKIENFTYTHTNTNTHLAGKKKSYPFVMYQQLQRSSVWTTN